MVSVLITVGDICPRCREFETRHQTLDVSFHILLNRPKTAKGVREWPIFEKRVTITASKVRRASSTARTISTRARTTITASGMPSSSATTN